MIWGLGYFGFLGWGLEFRIWGFRVVKAFRFSVQGRSGCVKRST